MRNLFKPTLITYIITALIITYIFLTNPGNIGFSSDSVYLPAVFTDVFIQGHDFSAWHFTPAPYFFPDMLIFFSISAVVHNVFYAFLVYAIIQACLILFFTSRIAFLITHKKSAVLLTHIFYLLALIFACSSNIEAYRVMLKSAHHIGTLVNGLALIYLVILYEIKPKKSTLLAISLLTTLATASDLLFIVQFVAPLIASLILCRAFKTQILPSITKLFFILLAACYIGFSVKYFFHVGTSSNYILTHSHSFTKTTHQIFLMFKEVFLNNLIISIAAILFYLTLIIRCIVSLSLKERHSSKTRQHKLLLFISFFILSSVIFTLESAAINSGTSMRYVINIFWFPIFFSWLVFGELFSKRMLWIILYSISLAVLARDFFPSHPYTLTYMPEVVQCVDAQIVKYNSEHSEKIKYGISTYWQEKLTTVFSTQGLIISQYTEDLHPRLWITSAENYQDYYDFAILSKKNRLDMDLIKQWNGKPSVTFKCTDDVTLLIYGKNKIRIPQKEN